MTQNLTADFANIGSGNRRQRGAFALNLASIGAASAQVAGGYKALVCVFLYGGTMRTTPSSCQWRCVQLCRDSRRPGGGSQQS